MAKRDKQPEGSLLRSAINLTPLAVGAGLGVRKAMSALRKTPSARMDPITQAVRGVTQTGSLLAEAQTGPELAALDQLTSDLATLDPATLSARGGMAKAAWRIATQTADPLLVRGLPQGGDVSQLGNQQALEAIHAMLRSQSSPAGRKLYSHFVRNLSTLTTDLMQHGAAPELIGTSFGLEANKPIVHATSAMRSAFARRFRRMGFQVQKATVFNRPGRAGHAFHQFTLGMGKNVFDINVPAVSNGFLVEGSTAQTTRLANDVMIWSNNRLVRMKRDEFLLHLVERDVLPRIRSGELQGRKIQSTVNKLYRETIQSLEVVQDPTSSYARIKSSGIDVLTPTTAQETTALRRSPWRGMSAYRQLNETELKEAIAASHLPGSSTKLFGGTSPTSLAAGSLSTLDLSQVYPIPEAADWSARIDQPHRVWELTDVARKHLKTPKHWSQYDSELTRQFYGLRSMPKAKTLFINADQHGQWLREVGKMGDGEALARQDFVNQLSWQRKAGIHLRYDTMRSDLLELWKKGGLKEGMVLGAEADSGNLITYKKGMNILDIVPYESTSRGKYATLHMNEVVKMTENAKVFGVAKATLHGIQGKDFEGLLSQIGQSGSGTQMIAEMSMLKKNPALHVEQMMTAMHDIFMTKGLDTSLLASPSLSNFLADPMGNMSRMKSKFIKNGIYDHDKTVLYMMGLARKGKFTPSEMGTVFGALPSVLSSQSKVWQQVGRLSPEAQSAIRAGTAQGIGTIAFGGLADENIAGSIEPRAFLNLRGGQLGDFGERLADELASRLAVTNPERVLLHQEIGKTLTSMKGQLTGTTALDLSKVSANELHERFQTFVREGGGMMRVGGGFSDIYIPGSETLTAMREYQTGGGKTVKSDLYDIYENLARAGTELHAGTGMTTADFRTELEQTMQELQFQHAPGGKGMAGILRGQVLGSRFLRGVSNAGTGLPTKDIFTVGISTKYAEKMLTEMEESGLYGRHELQNIRQRLFFPEAEGVGGALWRHPFTGQFSQLPVKVQVVPGMKSADVIINERLVELQQSNEAKMLRLSPLVGLSGDKDADIYSVALLGQRTEHAALKALRTDSDFMKAYTEHQIRYQLLKPKKAGAESTYLLDQITGGSLKLGTVQRYVPELSLGMTQTRAAAGTHLAGQERSNALTLLEYLENIPISAKHASTQDVLAKKLSGSLGQITSALRSGGTHGARELVNAMTSLSEISDFNRGLLEQGIELSQQQAATISAKLGYNINPKIAGIDLATTSENIMSSLGRFRDSGAAREMELMMGRARGFSLDELGSYLSKNIFKQGKSGTGAIVSNIAMTANNMLAEGGQMLRHAAPALALGFGASLALGAVLSSPKPTIGSGHNLNNVSPQMLTSKAANRMSPENVHPESQPLGNPSVPSMLHQPRVLLSQSQEANVRFSGRRDLDMSNTIRNIRSRLGGQASVGISVRDSRSIDNPHAYWNKYY